MSFLELLAGRRAALFESTRRGPIIVAPGVFDLVSAKVTDRLGFAAMYMTGYGVNASLLGRPDAGLGTYRDFVDRVRTISEQTQTPLIADADTGFGGALNVAETVRGYERAGAAAIQLEDQIFPKRCGHTLGRGVIPTADMALKVRVACDTRENKNFQIIARTDARTTLGLDEALRRADAYLTAGADIIFVESPETLEELRAVAERFKGAALMANMVPGGRTPMLAPSELDALGFRIVIYPVSVLMASVAAMTATLQQLKSSETPHPSAVTFAELNTLVGFDAIWDFDKKYQS